MSPPPSSNSQKSSAVPRLAGSAFAGVIELMGFHPVDTVAKRLMSNATPLHNTTTTATTASYSRIIFQNAHDAPLWRKYTSLFPGLSFAAGYKILQRVYKFGGQPFAREAVDSAFGAQIRARCGHDKQNAKIWLHGIAGALVGVGEVALLPLDVLKIKSQTNPAALRGRGLFTILREERLSGLYRGAGWTAARNAPGSFALFGASAFVKARVFGLQDLNDATFMQTFAASSAGGVASIVVASPLDVVKTRLQKANFGSRETGLTILTDLLAKEGPQALFKGLVPKVLVVGPKLVFSFTIAQHMIATFEHHLSTRRPSS